jgi:hypothetical protein
VLDTEPSTNSMVWIICAGGGGGGAGRQGQGGGGGGGAAGCGRWQPGGGRLALAPAARHATAFGRGQSPEAGTGTVGMYSTVPPAPREAIGVRDADAQRAQRAPPTRIPPPTRMPPHLVHHDLAKLKLLAVAAVPPRLSAARLRRRPRVARGLAARHALLVCWQEGAGSGLSMRLLAWQLFSCP